MLIIDMVKNNKAFKGKKTCFIADMDWVAADLML